MGRVLVSVLDLQARARRNAFSAMRELEMRRLEHEAVERAVAAQAAAFAALTQRRERIG
jgi:hypothetical protein